MSVQSEIDRIITAVGNAYSKVSEKGGTVPASQTVSNLATAIGSIPAGSAKETWVIKSDAAGEFATTQISFTSNGQKFTSIGTKSDDGPIVLRYDYNEVAGYDPAFGGKWYQFDNDAYRKLTFDTTPTGDLLTWLQANAVKQPDDTAVQDTKALTITSNGTVSVTPDAPYDGLSSVDVTVDVASGGGGENEKCYIEFQGYFPTRCFFACTTIAPLPFGGVRIMPSLVYISEDEDFPDLISILKNSSLFIVGITGDCVTEGSIAVTTNQAGAYAFWVTGDGKITFR